MWGQLRSCHGFRFGDLKSALQKAARRQVKELFMLVGFEFLYSKPCSINAGWKRLCIIVVEDYGSPELLSKVKGLYKRAIYAKSTKNWRVCMDLWKQALKCMFSYRQHRSNAWLARLYAAWCTPPEHSNPAIEDTTWRILKEMWRLQSTREHKVREATDLLFLAQQAVSTVTSFSNDTIPEPETASLDEWYTWWETNASTFELPDFVFDYHTSKGRRQGKGMNDFFANAIQLASPVDDAPHWMKNCEREALRLYHSSAQRTRDLFPYVKQQTGGSSKKRARDDNHMSPSARKSPTKQLPVPSSTTLASIFPHVDSVETCITLYLAQTPCGRKPPTYFAFDNLNDTEDGRFMKYAPGHPSVPETAEQLKKTLGLPYVTYEWHGDWMVTRCLLKKDQIRADYMEGYNFPVVQKGKSRNRKFQFNYALEDCETREQRMILLKRALPLQVLASVCGFTDAQHNNFVIADDGHVYMVDHMTQRKNNGDKLQALMDQPGQALRILYGNRPPPKCFQEDLWKAYCLWESEGGRTNMFWERLQGHINVNINVHRLRRYIWSQIDKQ
jgi:hypothetical protein